MSTRSASRASKEMPFEETSSEPTIAKDGKANDTDALKSNGSFKQEEDGEMKGFSEHEINGSGSLKNGSADITENGNSEIPNGEHEKSDTEEKIEPEEVPAQVNGVEATNGVVTEPELEQDEPEPELEFDENSDKESVQNASPVVSRCTTRRSQARNIPTPKTPKSAVQEATEEAPQLLKIDEEEEVESEEKEPQDNLNESTSSLDSDTGNVSTQAIAGSDATRINFTAHEFTDSPFLKNAKEQSFGDTLRRLSTRPSIRTAHDLPTPRKHHDRHLAYPLRASVESITGVKRRRRSTSPEDAKRIRHEPGGGILSYITSPVLKMRNRISGSQSMIPSSTPKLTGFRNKNSLLDSEEISKIKLDVDDRVEEKKWCSLM